MTGCVQRHLNEISKEEREIRGQSKCELGLMEQAGTSLPLGKEDKRQKERGVAIEAGRINDHGLHRILQIRSHRDFQRAGWALPGQVGATSQPRPGEESWKFCLCFGVTP